MDEKKQKKFDELCEKFIKKCLQEDMLPLAVLDYTEFGIAPKLSFREVTEEEKKAFLSSLNK